MLLSSRSGARPEARQFFARAGGLSPFAVLTYKNLIEDLVTAGAWQKLDCLYVGATATKAHSLLNLISPAYPITETGTVTFAANRGWYADNVGTTNYLRSGFNPTTAAGRFKQDSASIGLYCITSAAAGNLYSMGAYDGTIDSSLSHYQTGGTIQSALNDSADFINDSVGAGAGLSVSTRPAASSQKCYKNGTQTATSAGTTSNGMPNKDFWFLSRNLNGSPGASHGSEYSAFFIGGGLSAADNAALSSCLNTYMTAYGINAY